MSPEGFSGVSRLPRRSVCVCVSSDLHRGWFGANRHWPLMVRSTSLPFLSCHFFNGIFFISVTCIIHKSFSGFEMVHPQRVSARINPWRRTKQRSSSKPFGNYGLVQQFMVVFLCLAVLIGTYSFCSANEAKKSRTYPSHLYRQLKPRIQRPCVYIRT